MELIDQGRGSLLPDAPHGKALKSLLSNMWEPMLSQERRPEVAAQYQILRAEADAWQAQRTAYMMQRLQVGQHPDTSPVFWKDWHEPTPPSLYGSPFWQTHGMALSILGLALGISLLAVRFVRVKHNAPRTV